MTPSRPADLFRPTDRRDGLPPWVVVLLAAFLLLRGYELYALGTSPRLSQSLGGQVDEKTMAATVSANLAAKTAFASGLGKPNGAVPDPKALPDALKAAEVLQADAKNAPSAARRVIILRALLGRPAFGAGSNKLDPRDAYSPKALAGLPPDDIRRYALEGRVWGDVARGPHLSPAQTEADAAVLRGLPNIRWWRSPALGVLYRSQGDPARAARALREARTRAMLTLAPLTLIELAGAALGLGGVGLLLYFFLRSQRQKDAGCIVEPGLWPTLPELVPPPERRLRAGDLMGVFVLYLLMPDLLGWLLGGFGVPHRFHFAGLLAGYKAHVAALPQSRHVAANVVLEFFAYLFTATVPIGVLLGIARRRRASVGEELGWNTHRLGRNLLYGVGGYAISLPLLLVAESLGKHIHAPAPSNPAIPLLASAPTFWVQAVLVLLATVAAPLTEEFLFRGVFYNAAKLRLGVWPAIVLTGLIFGFVHPVGLAEMLPLATLGGVFAWMAETRKSLAPSIVGHFLQNSLATLLLLLALGG